MGRGIYEIHFKCACGDSHFTFTGPRGFLNASAAEQSVGAFYANQELPHDLKTFLAKPFVCPNRPDITTLPDLDDFFFQFTGQTTMQVG